MKPEISVVIPAYNEQDYLSQTLKAVTSQDFDRKLEIIVVDNNSTDKTVEIAKSFGARIVHEKNQGLIFAKQTGAKNAKADIIVVLDADNIPPPYWLNTIYEHLKDQNLSAVTGPYLLPAKTQWWAKVHTYLGAYLINIIQAVTGNSPHIWGGNVAFRKKDFDKFGGYDTRFTFAADEVKFRLELKRFGKIYHNSKLAVNTSNRRFKKGAFYFYFEFLLKDYLLNMLSTILFNKPFKHAQPIREEIS